MSRHQKVEIQKGSISPSKPPTLKMMTHAERVREQAGENALRRSGQTLTLHQPKVGKK